MKICITAQQNNLNSPIEPRFGRCRYFVIFDDKTQQYEAVKNTAISAAGGAGIKATQLLIDNQVDTLITGRIGPKAMNALETTNIQVILNASGLIKNVLEQLRNGELIEEKRPLISDTQFGEGRQRRRHDRR